MIIFADLRIDCLKIHIFLAHILAYNYITDAWLYAVPSIIHTAYWLKTKAKLNILKIQNTIFNTRKCKYMYCILILRFYWFYESDGFIYKLSLKLRWSLCDFIWVGRLWLLQNKLITRVAGSVYSSVMFVNVMLHEATKNIILVIFVMNTSVWTKVNEWTKIDAIFVTFARNSRDLTSLELNPAPQNWLDHFYIFTLYTILPRNNQ